MDNAPNENAPKKPKRFGLILVVVILLALIIGSTIWLLFSAQNTTEGAVYKVSEQYLEELTAHKALQFSQTVDNLKQQIAVITHALRESDYNEKSSLQDFIGDMKEYNDYDFFAFIDDKGTVYTEDSKFPGISKFTFLGRDLDKSIIAFDQSMDNKNYVFIYMPISDKTLLDAGITAALVGLNADEVAGRLMLDNIGVESFSSIIMPNGSYLIRSNDGHLAASSNIFSILEKDAVFSEGNSIEEMKANMAENKPGMISYELDNETHYSYYMPIEGTENWFITTTLHYDLISEHVDTIRTTLTRNNIVQLTLILIVLFAMFAVYMYMRKRSENLRLQKIQAEENSKAKSVFLSNMSHDIRTPMNAIIGFTNLAVKKIDNKEQTKEYLDKILVSSDHLLSLINDVLEMSRIESGKITLEDTECNLEEILQDLSGVVIGQARSKDINLQMYLKNVKDKNVFIDKLRINQVFLNLIGNAVKFTPNGGKISVVVEQTDKAAEPGYGSYKIRVKDTGIGMTPEFAEKIFMPFERERTSTVSGIQGTGLGMSITKNIVDLMGGNIDIVTAPGEGTEFIISVDLKLADNQTQTEPISELEGTHALVISEDPEGAQAACDLLKPLGLIPNFCENSSEALSKINKTKDTRDEYSVYLIDGSLKDENSIEFITKIREAVTSKPIILLVDYDLSSVASDAVDAGADGCCAKPLFSENLRAALEKALGIHSSLDDLFEDELEKYSDFVGKRILLVEDNELNREIALEILEDVGFETDYAKDGAEAVEKVKNSEPGYYDLVLMDIQMPIMNGYDATRAIRTLENPDLASVPIIAMTANAFEEDRRAALEAGMNDHTTKPLDTDKLFEVLMNLFKK